MAYSEKYKQARSKWLNDQGESLPEPEPAVRVPSQKFLEMQNKWKAETPDVQEDDLPQLTPKGESVGWDKINSGLKSIAKSYSSKFGTPTYTSGFRTQEEQDSLPVVGKARVSRHTSGRALDERIKDLTPEQIQQRLSFYNSQPKTKASVHNKNHIHVEYLGDDAPIEDVPISKEPPKDLNPIDSFYNRFQKAIVSGAGKKSTLTNDRKVSSAPMSPDDPISEMMGDYARENKLDNLKNRSTSTVPRVTNIQRSPEVRKFFDEWLQPQSDSTFIDTPVVPPAISRTIAKVANKTTPLQFLTPKVQDAVEEFLSENISGFTTPKNLGIGGALLTPAAPYVLAATLPGMIEGTYEAGKGTYEAVKNKDTKGIVKGGLNTILSALMTGGGIKGSAKGIAGDFAKVRSKIQAPEPTVPEAPQTIQAQIDSLKQGRNKAVLLTEGEVPADLPSNIKTIQTDVGTWLFDPLKINKTKIQKSVENGTYGNILGHKEIKGPETTEVVTARLPNGVEAKSSVVSPDNLNSQAKELKRQFPDSSIEFGGPEKAQQIISERKSLVRAPEPVYLGSGLGGLQQLFEKDPIQQARLEKISNIEKEAKASNKKLAEVYKEKEANGEAFDPDLYSELMTRQRELARKAEKSPTWQRVQDFKREVKTKLVDSASPMEDVLRYWEKEHPDQKPINSLTRTEVLTDRIDKSLRSVNMATQFIKENGLEGVVKSLESIKDLDRLDQYLIAKHAPEREALSKTTGRELDLDNKFIQAKAQEFEPHAKIVQDYAQKLLDYSVDAGLVIRNNALELKQRYPNYVPLNRVFNELEVVPSNFKPKGPASIGKQTVVQKAVGSSREIESPIASLMEKTADAFMQGERNKTAQYLTGLETLEGNPFSLRKLKPDEKPSLGMDKISVFRDGVKEIWETSPEIAAAAKSLNIQQFGLLAKMLRKPSLIFKAGTTGVYPVFALMNLIKDTGHALTLSKNSRGGALSTPFGLKEAYSGGEFSKMLAREGAMDSSFDPFRNQFLKNVKEIRSDKDLANKLKFRINPLNIFKNIEDVINVGERTTRIAQAKAAYDSALKSGMSVQDAQIKAALAYRKTTTDFFRKGEWGNVMNSISPYLNAGIQGSRTLVRRLHESPIKTTSKIMALIALPTALSTIYNLNDPKRREAYMDMNEKEKDDNIVVISPWASFNKDSNSWEGIVKIPKPQGISSLLRPMTKYIEHLYDVDPQSFGSMAKELLNAGAGAVLPFEPSAKGIASFAIPPPIKGIAENVYNKDFYFNKPIVPDYIDRQPSRDLPPERQTLPRTSFVANKLGNALKVSPLKIDHQIRSTFGSMGYSTTRALDSLLNLTGVAPDKEVQRLEGKPLLNLLTLGTAPEFSRRLSKVRGGEIDRKIADEAHIANQDSFVKKQDIHRSAVAFLEDMKNLSSEEKRQRIDELVSQPEVMKKVMKLMEEEASGFTYADKAIDNLSTKDGTRARFISQKLKSFKNSDDRNRFLDNLIEKKLITKEVMQQMMAD